jgi:formylmethanofuran--tetrahydromethanopterin N-formyltransferase
MRGQVASLLPPEARCAYEIVVDGLTLEAVENAMRAGLEAAAGPGVVQITAGNYGGKLGPHHIRLHDLLARA